MRLDLRDIIHVPDARKEFRYQLDLSQLDFFGRRPIVHPVLVEGGVTNHAGALVLEGTASSPLELVCDRCGKPFTREKTVILDSLLAQELEDEENDDILLLDGTSWTWTRPSPLLSYSGWTPKTFAQTTAKGCAPSAGPT